MALRISSKKSATDTEIRFSYFVKKPKGKPSRVGFARVLDMSETGLCMEISPLDSDLFMDSFEDITGLHREIELQIFCRSHPSNVFVGGSVQWFKQKKEFDGLADELDLCAGVIFSISDNDQRRQLSELLGHLDNDTVCCRECNAPVSVDAVFCYNCGARLIRRRTVLSEAIYSLLVPDPADGK